LLIDIGSLKVIVTLLFDFDCWF